MIGLNHYTELLTYIKSLADADIFVNTVTQGDTSDYDLDKGNLFPVFNIDILRFTFPTPSVIQFEVEISCMQLRDNNKEIRTDKFWLQDNKVDNLNETLATLNRVWVNMSKDFQDKDITAGVGSGDEVTEWNKNLVDGWLLTFTVTMPNTTVNLCT